MKRLSMMTAVGALVLFAGAAHAAVVMHQNVNGIYVNASSFDGTTATGLTLYRTVANGPDSPGYALIYSIMSCDNGYPILTCDGIRGLGLLPGGSTQSNTRTAHLHVDTSTVVGFATTHVHDVIDSTSGVPVFTETWNTIPGLAFDLTWQATNQFQTSLSGSSKSSSFGVTTTLGGGTQSFSTATVSGSLGSISLQNADGAIGQTHNVQLTVEKN